MKQETEAMQQEPEQTNLPESSHADGKNTPRFHLRKQTVRLIKFALNSLLALLSSLFLTLIMSVLLFVYSQDSREWIIAQGLPSLLSVAGVQLEIRNLRSPSPSEWMFELLSVQVEDRQIVRLEHLHVQVNDWSLFKHGLDIKMLSAASMHLNLSSNTPEEESETVQPSDISLHDFLSQPLGFRLQTLDVKRIELSGLATEIPVFSIQGNAFLNIQSSLNVESEHWLNTELVLQVLDAIPTQVKLQATLNKNTSGQLDLSIDEAAGGWLARLLNFPAQQNIHGQLKFQLQPDEHMEQINWQVNALQLPWYQHQLGFNGSGNWHLQSSKLNIEQAELLVDQARQSFSGWWQKQDFALALELKNLPLALADPFQDIIKGGTVSGRVNASGSFSDPQFSSNIDLKTAFLQRAATLKLEAEGNLRSVQIKQADLQVDKAKARLSGQVNVEQQTLDLDVLQLQGPVSIISMFDAQLPEGLKIELLQTEGKLTGSILAPNYAGKTQAKGSYQSQTFTLSGGFDGNIEQVRLIAATLLAGNASLKANGVIDWQNSQLDLSYNAGQVPATLLSLAGVEIPENLIVHIGSEGNIKGAFEQLNINANAKIHGTFEEQPLNSVFSVSGTVNKLKFSDFKAQLGEAIVHATGTVEPLKQKLDLKLSEVQISTGILRTLLTLPEDLHAEIRGNGALKGSFTQLNFIGELETYGRYKQAMFEIHTNLDASPETLEFMALSSQLTLGEQSARVQAEGRYSIQNNTLNAQIKTAGLPLSIIELADITLPETLSGEINADISVAGSLPLPGISGKLETRGQYNGDNFELAFNGTQEEQTFKLQDVNAKWKNTSVFAQGELSQERLDLIFSLQQFQISDLSRLGLTLPSSAVIPSGLLDVHLELSGSVKEPQLHGTVELALAEQIFNTGYNTRQQAITLKSQIETKEQRLFLHTYVLQGSETKADISLGARFSPLLDWLLSPDGGIDITETALDISAQGKMELAWLNDWLQEHAQHFSGDLELDMQILGSVKEPILSGNLALIGGKYQNAISQTRLEQAEIQLSFEKQKINVVHASASDGLGGQLRLEGGIDLGATEDDQIELTLILDKASLLRREDIEGEASGQLKLIGSLNNMRLSGGLEVTPFQIMLDRISSDSIPEIEVRTVQTGSTVSPDNAPQTTVNLDLVINVDQQAFIRGRGLDAELKGKLQLSGTGRQTNYNGRFQVIRGTVDLFAKTFKLEQGSVLFSNDSVSLFAQARHKAKDLTFIATLEGLLDNLKISLRTEPALPEDEALARLLFGKSVRNITPVQAIQLANAIQTLRGEGGQFDPLGTARDILQVDRISIESQETNDGTGVAIGLGKYVTEKVYVEVTRTPEPTQPWKGSVEVELTPNINLETTTSGSSGFGGVELQWKRDY